MQLYHNSASPFCRKVDVLLREVGLRDDVSDIHAAGHTTEPGSMPTGANPIGKIPTLVRNDGPALFDSRVICRYLDAKKGSGLYPDSRLWEVLTLEALADGMLDAATLMVYEIRSRPEDRRHPPWIEGQWARIDRALDQLNDTWLSHLHGPLTMGQIAVACALGYLDFRHSDRNWRNGRDPLAAWYAVFDDRPSMQATLPSG